MHLFLNTQAEIACGSVRFVAAQYVLFFRDSRKGQKATVISSTRMALITGYSVKRYLTKSDVWSGDTSETEKVNYLSGEVWHIAQPHQGSVH